jgi:hypothetical protein
MAARSLFMVRHGIDALPLIILKHPLKRALLPVCLRMAELGECGCEQNGEI